MTDSNNDGLAIELYEAMKDACEQNLHTTKNLLVSLDKLYHANLLKDRSRFFADLDPMFKAHMTRGKKFLSKIEQCQ